jgi:hypothetical protein
MGKGSNLQCFSGDGLARWDVVIASEANQSSFS